MAKDSDSYLTWFQSRKVDDKYWHTHEHWHISSSSFTKWMQFQNAHKSPWVNIAQGCCIVFSVECSVTLDEEYMLYKHWRNTEFSAVTNWKLPCLKDLLLWKMIVNKLWLQKIICLKKKSKLMLLFNNSIQSLKMFNQVGPDLFTMSAYNTPVHLNTCGHLQLIYDFKVKRF